MQDSEEQKDQPPPIYRDRTALSKKEKYHNEDKKRNFKQKQLCLEKKCAYTIPI